MWDAKRHPDPGGGRREFAVRPSADGVVSRTRRIVARREVGLVCAMAAVVIPVTLINPRMISGENLTAIAMDAALLMIVAVKQMLVMLTHNIDLSVASVIGLSAYGASELHAQSSDEPRADGRRSREPDRARLRAS